MKKGFIFLLGMGLIFGGWSFAHDCHLFTETSVKIFDDSLFDKATKGNPALMSITKEGLHRALINLKTHCCAANILNNNPAMLSSCKEDKLLLEERTNYPQSSYLIDHLIDVMMRRLAVEWNYEDVNPDPIAKERIDHINTIAKSGEWTIPPALSKDYNSYRKAETNYLIPFYNGVSSNSYRQVIENEEATKARYSQFSNRNLRTRYQNLCQTAIYLSTILPVNFNSDELSLAQNECNKLISQTIQNETDFFSELIRHKSDLLLEQTMKNYANEYLMKTRGEAFIERLIRMNSNLLWVVRMIPLLVKITN